MYADDGIFLLDYKVSPFTGEVISKLAKYGIFISYKLKKNGTPSSGFVDVLTFLGITWNSVDDTLRVGERWIKRELVSRKTLLGIVWNGYGGQTIDGHWDINPNSLMYRRHRTLTWGNFVLFWKWFFGVTRVQRCRFKFFDWQVESSRACGWMMRLRMAGSCRKVEKMSLNRKFPCPGAEIRMTFGIVKAFGFYYWSVYKLTRGYRPDMSIWEVIDWETRERLYNQWYGGAPLYTIEVFDNWRTGEINSFPTWWRTTMEASASTD